MAATALVLTWYHPAVDAVAGYADWLRMVHVPEGVRLIEGVEAGRLFELDEQRPVMTDPLAFPLFSMYEFTDDPELIFERARSVERQAWGGGPVYCRTLIQKPVGARHGSTAGGDLILVELNRYPDDLRKAIVAYQQSSWMPQALQLAGLLAAQRYEKHHLDHPSVPFSAPFQHHDVIIWELENDGRGWLDARRAAGLESGIPSSQLSEADGTRAALSERRSGMYRRLK